MNSHKISRRHFIGSSSITGVAIALSSEANAAAVVTPPQVEGPFYPIVQQADTDTDLTLIGDSTNVAEGEIILVEGRVLDESNNPIAGAVVDVWQANAAGRYAHEADPNPAPLDANFQGWAIMKTDSDGGYRFKTVKPGAYPAEKDWTRPPHIHFKVARRGYREITTQMYFDGEPLNDIDLLIQELSVELQSTLIASRESEDHPFVFDVVLAKV